MFDATGTKVTSLHTGKQMFNGLTEFSFNSSDLGISGLYFIRVKSNNSVETKTILITN